MPKNKALQFCNEVIHPGECLSLALPLPELFSCAPLYMPLKVMQGKESGPCFLVTAAMHGNELNGTEIINRLFASKNLKRIRGTLIAVPVMNVYGLINRARNLPGGVSLDRCFPGSKTGTHAARVANIFIEEVFSKADVCLDLQTGFMNYTNLPQIYVNVSDERSKALAHAFNAPVISNLIPEKGMLPMVAETEKKPFLRYEAGGAMSFDEHAIKVGLRGVMNVMRQLDMLDKPDKTEKLEKVEKVEKTGKLKKESLSSFITEKNIWVRAPGSGISLTKHKLGQYVKKNESLCIIKDPFGATDSVTVKSPEEGIIVGKNNLPLVYEGEALFKLATFSTLEHAAPYLEGWKEKNDERFKESNVDEP